MGIVVQKYGGSSLADAEKIKNVAQRIAKTKDTGVDVVVVASAMGDTTDNLIELANQITNQPDEREMDVLMSTGETVSCTLIAMALQAMDYKAISLSGAQAGIKTTTVFGKAQMLNVNPNRVEKELSKGKIVIVAGFQGITDDEDITTLGRGGSNATAVALAAKLKADMCVMYTDVEGVYTADPRIVQNARKLKEIGYEEMLEMASYGTAVLQSRSVELGEVYNVPIMVASSFSDAPGTLIHGGANMEVRNRVRGIAHDLNVAKITVVGLPNKPGVANSIFAPLSKANISVDTIVQNASVENNVTDLTFTVTKNDLRKALKVAEPVAKSIGAKECLSDSTLGKISIIGSGMQSTPGYAAKMFQCMYEEGINIELITTSEIRITCIIDQKRIKDAVQALHKAFDLEKED
ncbi:MAG: aspartate kinase [Chloroflexi bacterium]|nr:aspartate kinase [Chloroflexota bacterium]